MSIALRIAALENMVKGLNTDEARIARMPGRVVPYDAVLEQAFEPRPVSGGVSPPFEGVVMRWEVTEDGPFVMTHYPQMVWRPTSSGADTEGMWRSIASFPYPDESDFSGGVNAELDYINLSWSLKDTKSGRLFQSTGGRPPNATQVSNTFDRVPAILSSLPAWEARLPKPCYFESGTTILFTPYYEDINFGSDTPPTAGLLRVVLPGYRIIP